MRVVIAGGGTAGHVFPSLALADKLVEAGDEVSFIGSSTGQEAHRIPAAGHRFLGVASTPMKRELSLATAKAPLIALSSARACLPLVRSADVVVGVGGYASVPAVLAARWSRRPIVLHEQNAIPSASNRALARSATAVAVSFEESRSAFGPRVRTVVTGNPVRAAVVAVDTDRKDLASQAWPALDLDPDRTTVGVFGGSLGALHLDRTVAGAIDHLRERSDLQLLVLTGPDHLHVVADRVREPMRLRVRAVPFLDRVELALAITDLAVARAGAGTIAELTVAGVPSILVPYPHATENHQEANARALVAAGAAELYLDASLSPEGLASRIMELMDDARRREAMTRAAFAWSRPDAAERVVALVREVAA